MRCLFGVDVVIWLGVAMKLPMDLKLKMICDYVEANRVHPDGRPMLANNISARGAAIILERWR